MKPNVMTAGTGRKRRQDTLPGPSGANANELALRKKTLGTLRALMRSEYAQLFDLINNPDPSMNGKVTYWDHREAKDAVPDLRHVSIPTLLKISTMCDVPDPIHRVAPIIRDVMGVRRRTWSIFAGDRLEGALIDALSYRAEMPSDSSVELFGISDSKHSMIFEEVYNLTLRVPGTLESLTGHERSGVVALMRTVNDSIGFRSFGFGVKSSQTFEFDSRVPQRLADHLIAYPENAEVLADYLKSRDIKVEHVDIDGFIEFKSALPALRDGVL
jgi:hypothetical protein